MTPEELEFLPYELSRIFADMEKEILDVIANDYKFIMYYDTPRDYYTRIAERVGISKTDIKKAINKAKLKADKQYQHFFDEQAESILRRQKSIYDYKGFQVPTYKSKNISRIVDNTMKISRGDLENFTNTMGIGKLNINNLTDVYKTSLNKAFIEVNTGFKTADAVLRETVKNLAKQGVTTINYNTGVARSVESAVRNSVRTSLQQLTNSISNETATRLGADGMETTAHAGARPSHTEWQGQQFAMKEYKGSIEPQLNEYGCRHSAYPIFIGISKPMYSKQDLNTIKKADNTIYNFRGKDYTRYKATQNLRQLEREVRKCKKEINALKAIKLDSTDVKILQKQLMKEYKTLANQMDEPINYVRFYVG